MEEVGREGMGVWRGVRRRLACGEEYVSLCWYVVFEWDYCVYVRVVEKGVGLFQSFGGLLAAQLDGLGADENKIVG